MPGETTEWMRGGSKIVRREAGERRWRCIVMPQVEDGAVTGRWLWMVSWPGHTSPKSRQEGQAETVLEAAACADEFARSVGLVVPGSLPDALAAEMNELFLEEQSSDQG